MEPRLVRGPDGREWTLSSYRFRRPPWRARSPDLGLFEVESGFFGAAFLGALVYLPLALVTAVLWPLAIFVVELPTGALRAWLSPRRVVVAEHAGPPLSRLRWETSAERLDTVVEQVARQLELGYERVQPHGARFLGFESA